MTKRKNGKLNAEELVKEVAEEAKIQSELSGIRAPVSYFDAEENKVITTHGMKLSKTGLGVNIYLGPNDGLITFSVSGIKKLLGGAVDTAHATWISRLPTDDEIKIMLDEV
jgi:hypothetical protein